MSDDTIFGESMDNVKAEQEQEKRDAEAKSREDVILDFDVDEFLDGLEDGPKNETIGIAVTEEQHAVWKELRKPSDQGGTDADLTQRVRDMINKQANLNKSAAKRAGLMLEIERMVEGESEEDDQYLD